MESITHFILSAECIKTIYEKMNSATRQGRFSGSGCGSAGLSAILGHETIVERAHSGDNVVHRLLWREKCGPVRTLQTSHEQQLGIDIKMIWI
jgi:hypothetical protein